MGSELLEVTRVTYKREATPLFMTFPVNIEAAPFLVSSPKGFVWVPEVQGGYVHTAVRTIKSREVLYGEILSEVVGMGQNAGWGNVHPLTSEGVQRAIDYVRYYGFEELEILVPAKQELSIDTRGLNTQPVSWLDGMALVIPSDRSFVGTLGFLTPKKGVVLIHNPSRGLGIAKV